MADEQETIAIPLVEERLTTDKRLVETGRVRVRTLVDERQEVVRDRVTRQSVEAEHVPIGREISSVPPVREEGDTTIIPVVEEQIVVTKKLVLVEEVRLTRRQVTEEQEVPVTVRSQRAVVEREESSGDHPQQPRSE